MAIKLVVGGMRLHSTYDASRPGWEQSANEVLANFAGSLMVRRDYHAALHRVSLVEGKVKDWTKEDGCSLWLPEGDAYWSTGIEGVGGQDGG